MIRAGVDQSRCFHILLLVVIYHISNSYLSHVQIYVTVGYQQEFHRSIIYLVLDEIPYKNLNFTKLEETIFTKNLILYDV